MIPTERFLTAAHRWQLEALAAFDTGVARFFSLEWHRRSRKTTWWLNLAIREACRWPRRTYLLIGPTKEQERQIVWDDPNMLDAALPDRGEMPWEKNEQKLQVTFGTGSRVVVRGSDDPDSIRGVGPWGVGFDEWALVDPATWSGIIRPIIAEDKTRWAAFMYTPKGPNHATEMHDAALAGSPNWHASTLRASQSGIIDAGELALARRDMPPTLYDQEFECSRITDEERTLITSRMIAALVEHSVAPECMARRRIVSCDPAMGGDECVCQYIVEGRVAEQMILHDRDSMKVAGAVAIMGEQHQCRSFIADTIGNGKGVVDRLSELGLDVQPFNSAEASMEPDRFANRRIDAWWYAMRCVQDKLVPPIQDPELVRQLCATHWQPQASSGRLILEPKERTRKSLGRSPDRADAFVMGLWGLRNVIPDGQPTHRRRQLEAAGNSWRTA